MLASMSTYKLIINKERAVYHLTNKNDIHIDLTPPVTFDSLQHRCPHFGRADEIG